MRNMNKSLTAAVVGCLAVVACLSLFAVVTFSGCGDNAGGDVVVDDNKPVDKTNFGERPVDPNRVVDSQVSWKKFLAEAKQAERIQAAEKKFQEGGPANNVKIVFMKDEIEYVKFGALKLKNIEPERLYEVGVITLAAKETWGSDGFEIREYKLKFVTPRRDGEWVFVLGTYKVSKSSGVFGNADPTQLKYVEDKQYQNGYLRQLFIKPLVGKPAAGAAVNQNQGGEQPVETKIQPQP
jgi:hypothetical protein